MSLEKESLKMNDRSAAVRYFVLTTVVCFSVLTMVVGDNSLDGSTAEEEIVMDIWPEGYLGEKTLSRGIVQESKGDNIIRLSDVEIPSMTVYRADGAGPHPAVLVFPGGGFSILAMNLEGTEIAEWLNSRGITAAVLKYRVPKNPAGAFEDAQRAMSLLRHQSVFLGLVPDQIGVIGFSAGGNLAGKLCTNFEKKVYDAVDEVDGTSCRPDFAMLVYPYVLDRDGTLAKDIKITAETPPAILIQTQDDFIKADNSIYYFLGLKEAGVPAELHVFPSGGHGYGLRPSEHAVSGWPELCNTWLEGILGR
jgi:acetyl esterase/lipase